MTVDNDERREPTESSPLLRSREGDEIQRKSNGTNGTRSCDEEALRNGHVDAANAVKFDGLPDVQKQLKYIVPAISLGVFLAAADQTIIVASYGKIGSDLDALNLTSWVATSYFLSLTSFQPLFGRLSDIFGRKPCLLFGYALFGTGCVLCGLARDMKELIAARILQGIGGSGMSTVVSILMSDIVPLRDRGLWQGIINIIYAVGSGLGAPLGGFMADSIGWRWSFISQGPLCLLAFLTVSITLTLPTTEQGNWRTKLGRIDFLGAGVLVSAVFGLIFGLDRGSNVSWSIPLTIISLSASLVLFIVFLGVEIYIASEPLAPGHIIFDRSLLACYFCNFFSMGGWLAALFYIPLFFQARDGLSATGAGIRLLPSIIAGVCGSLLGGYSMKKTGKYFRITVVAYFLLTVGLLMIFLCSGIIFDSTPLIIFGMVLCGFGNGVGITTTLIGLLANASPEDQAVVTACSYLFRSLGPVIALGLSASVVQQSLRSFLRSALKHNKDIDKIVDGVRQSLDYVKNLDPDTQLLVRYCYGRATNIGFGFMTCIVFFAFVSACFIREQKLSA